MSTIRDLVADVRRTVYGTMTEQINLIQESASAGVTEIKLELGTDGITRGTMISSGLNVWYVKGVSPNDNTVFVIPGYDNAPLQDVEAGDIVSVRPRLTDWYAFNTINDEIKKLSSPTNGLYRLDSWLANSDSTYQTYDVPVEAQSMVNLLRVRWRAPGTPDVWAELPPRAWKWQLAEGVNRIQLYANIPSSTEVEFTYKAPFTVAHSLDDDPVADCGLSESMLDIPPLGAAIMLLRTTEARRNQIQTQGDSRRAAEVSTSGNASIANQMQREYDSRVNDEYVRLVTRMPISRGV